MLSKSMETALNNQLLAENFSAYLYLSMSARAESLGYLGSAQWMARQFKEEASHAAKIYRFILDRDGQVVLGAIIAPQSNWDSPLAIFKDAHAHEEKVTVMIDSLMDLARAEKDYATEIFLQWFVMEQIEEEASTSSVVRRFERAGERGVFFVDKELKAMEAPGSAAAA